MELRKDKIGNDVVENEKAVEQFINVSLGRLDSFNPQSSFYSQKAYQYASDIVNKNPHLNQDKKIFHYTTGHLKEERPAFQGIRTESNFLRTNRTQRTIKSSRVDKTSPDFGKERNSFNSVFELDKTHKRGEQESWHERAYRFPCSDRKQEYCALDDYGNDMFQTKTRCHIFRNPKPQRPVCDRSFDVKCLITKLNKKPNQLQNITVSMLEDSNFMNKEKYGFDKLDGKRPRPPTPGRHPKEPDNWKKYYRPNSKLLEDSKIASLLMDKPVGADEPREQRLRLTHIPLKSDVLDRQRDLSHSRIKPSIFKRPSSTHFFSYQRGVYDIIYPRAIVH